MEKRVLIAAILSAIFLSWYAKFLTRWTSEQGSKIRTAQEAQNGDALSAIHNESAFPSLSEEEASAIESGVLRAEIGQSTGDLRQATLKNFKESSGKNPLHFGGKNAPIIRILIGSAPITCHTISSNLDTIALDGKDKDNNSYHILYSLDSSNQLLKIAIERIGSSLNSKSSPVSFILTWERADGLGNRNNPLEVIVLNKKLNGKFWYKRYLAPFRSEKNVPRGTSMVSLAERYFCISMKPEGGSTDVSLIPSPSGTATIIVEARFEDPQVHKYVLDVYVGPRDYFYLRRAGFESSFPIGALGQIGLILLALLKWIAGITKSYGVAIIALAAAITGLTAPFTMLSFKSMKKMQQLKPDIDRITARHKGDPTKANREIFMLYKEHRVSPISGCLPIFLQMPIFIALFQAISHFIELRGRSFLWIADLSLPDQVAKFPFSLPLLGSDLNALPIVMAVAMYLQTRMSQQSMKIDRSDPTAKLTSGPFMSIIFGFMFYQFPSGLVLYWLTNSLMSLVWYRLANKPA